MAAMSEFVEARVSTVTRPALLIAEKRSRAREFGGVVHRLLCRGRRFSLKEITCRFA